MSESELVEYVRINAEHKTPGRDKAYCEEMLRTEAETVTFPLTDEARRDLAILEAQFDAEENMAGVAAPQIGIKRKMIVFSAPDDEGLKKWRPDHTQIMDRTVWINPSYTPLSEELSEDYEGCFSVDDMAGRVRRYRQIAWHAWDVDGNELSGEAEGFLARIIQHEVDHINGILYCDIAVEGSLHTIEEYRELRRQAMEADETV